ncbi:MAG: T9SS type A sorting domain-containing protein [candidate division Zixibacteria bacterium]|nr:T9SS type A sorting domain-containing protein [candidate division Zixibacteria bacterium]
MNANHTPQATSRPRTHFGRRSFLWLVLPLVLLAAPIAMAQTPSTLDTARVINVQAALGDTFFLDFYMRNVDTLGGFNFRITYDRTLIEPLTDTTVNGTDTTISVEGVQLLRGTAGSGDIIGAGLPSPGVMTFVFIDFDQLPTQLFLPGQGASVRIPWRVRQGATTQTTAIAFENDPNFPASFNTFTDWRALIFKRPVLTNGAVTLVDSIPGGGGGSGNQAPTIPVLASPLSVNQGDLLTFNVTATDPEGDSLNLTASNLPTGATFIPSNPVRGRALVTGTYRWTPNFSQSGSFVVSFQARDDSNAASAIRNVTINVVEVPTDRLFTTSVEGQEPQGGVPGAVRVVVPINFSQTQNSFGVQFDLVYDPTVFTPTSLQPSDKLVGFSLYDNLGDTPGRIRVVTFSLAGDPIAAGSSSVLFNVVGNIVGDAAPGAYPLTFENAWESINPDPNVSSVHLTTANGTIFVDFAGDANLDTRVDIGDVVAVVGYILGDFTFTGRQFGSADVNGDHYLDVFDLVAIINSIFGAPPVNTIPESGAPAIISFTYAPVDGPNGTYVLSASVPTDVAGAQFEIDYDPAQMALAVPEQVGDATGLELRYRNNGRGRLVALLLYNPTDPNSRIRPGTGEILRIPLLAKMTDSPAAHLAGVKLSNTDAKPIEVAGYNAVPRDFVLDQNYPNPFNAGTTIAFALADGASGPRSTRLEIFNVLGQRVTTLLDEQLSAGRYERVWDGRDHSGATVASGLYFYRLTTPDHAETKKMVLLK